MTSNLSTVGSSFQQENQTEENGDNLCFLGSSTSREQDFPIQQKNFEDSSGFDYNNVTFFRKGTKSTIYKAERSAKNSQKVVIKMLKKSTHENIFAIQELTRELSILSSIVHDNIIKLVASGNNPRKFISVEYLEGGSLLDLLQKNKESGIENVGLSYLSVLSIAIELVAALKYLHEDFHRDAVIIHRDIKPQNIGFASNGKLKLFDFGLATCVKRRTYSAESFFMTGRVGTMAYMAHEVALCKPYNEKVDIYGFGMILWQLVTGQMPFCGVSREEYMLRVVHGGVRPPMPANLPHKLAHLIRLCWDMSQDNRPDANTIKKQLESLLKSFTAGGQQCSSHSIAAGNDGSMTMAMVKMNSSSNIINNSGSGSSHTINNNKKNLLHRAVSVGKLSLMKPLHYNSSSKIAVTDHNHTTNTTNLVPLPHHHIHHNSLMQTQQRQPNTHRSISCSRVTDTVLTKFVPKKATSKVVPRVLRGPIPLVDDNGPPSPFIIRHF